MINERKLLGLGKNDCIVSTGTGLVFSIYLRITSFAVSSVITTLDLTPPFANSSFE